MHLGKNVSAVLCEHEIATLVQHINVKFSVILSVNVIFFQPAKMHFGNKV